MGADSIQRHRESARHVREAIGGPSGDIPPDVREQAAARAGGGAPIAEPYDALAKQIGEAAYRVTDRQVDAVLSATGSERGTFEIVMAASLGAGLARWDAAIAAIEAANDAPA